MNPAESSSTPDAEPRQPSPGQMLRAAREAKGMHLAMLSVALKVSTRQLEALESDDYSAFRGVTFLRALAQSVCRHLAMDPAPVLAGLPQSSSPLMVQPPSLDSHVPSSHGGRRTSPLRSVAPSRPVILLALLMLAGSAALIWWPAHLPHTEAATQELADSAQAAVPMGQASNPLEMAPVTAAAAASTPATAAIAAEIKPVPAAPPLANATPAATAATSAASVPASSAALVLRPKVDAWIEVRDSRGQMLVKRLVKAGEILQQETQAPVFVYVSRADSTELLWQGKPVDLKPHTQNNEARLQIKP